MAPARPHQVIGQFEIAIVIAIGIRGGAAWKRNLGVGTIHGECRYFGVRAIELQQIRAYTAAHFMRQTRREIADCRETQGRCVLIERAGELGIRRPDEIRSRQPRDRHTSHDAMRAFGRYVIDSLQRRDAIQFDGRRRRNGCQV